MNPSFGPGLVCYQQGKTIFRLWYRHGDLQRQASVGKCGILEMFFKISTYLWAALYTAIILSLVVNFNPGLQCRKFNIGLMLM